METRHFILCCRSRCERNSLPHMGPMALIHSWHTIASACTLKACQCSIMQNPGKSIMDETSTFWRYLLLCSANAATTALPPPSSTVHVTPCRCHIHPGDCVCQVSSMCACVTNTRQYPQPTLSVSHGSQTVRVHANTPSVHLIHTYIHSLLGTAGQDRVCKLKNLVHDVWCCCCCAAGGPSGFQASP
jgi:hypothetical protein